jgi:nucleoside-diphosphate-sugar epimerase
VTTIRLPGSPGVGHSWAFLPDVARTMQALLARRHELPSFARFHMAGHWDADGLQMASAIQRVVQRHGGNAQIRAFPWWLVSMAAPAVTTLRELKEMRYLWREPVSLCNTRLTALLGAEPHTDLDTAVEATLAGLGCLPKTAARSANTASPR